VGDLWQGDDFFHNGAFRLSYGYEFATMLESSREMTEPKLEGPGDAYDWYLRMRSLTALDTLVKGRFPTWAAFVAHPSYDAYWRARDVRPQINRRGDRRVPTLVVGGRWDQEDPLGPLVTYSALERGDSLNVNTLVLGPWHHGQWSMGSGRHLGAIDWGTQTGRFFRDSVEAPWFAHWLKDAPAPELPEALVYRSGDNKWDRLTRWPAALPDARSLFLRDSGTLAFDAPRTASPASDSYVSDPANPVPFRPRPIKETFGEGMPGWWTWLAADQRFVADRRDVLHWQTTPLTEDVTVTGDVVAKLFASTTGSDADWVVKLIDVYPDTVSGTDSAMAGYQLMVAGDILRGRYRRSFGKPIPVKPGAIEPYALTLRGVDHTFRRGHRIMVQVQSSWFPLYDRNPQTWVPNIFTAPPSAFRAATQRVYRSARYPSRVELPVVAGETR
jgi:putative CocE/NonD family hydrolase